MGARFQDVQVPLGIEPVLPLLVEDAQEALTHRVAAASGHSGPSTGLGVAVQRLVGQAVEDLAHGGHPVTTQLEDHVERRS